MKRIVFATLIPLAFAVTGVAGCHSKGNNSTTATATPSATFAPSSGTVKPEVPTGIETSVKPSDVSVVDPSVAEIPDFSGTAHDADCKVDHLGVGKGLIESKQVDEGIAELEKGVFDEPENFDIRKTIGEAYLAKGELEMAAGHLRAATEQVDDADTWQELAQTYFDLKDYDQSVKAIRMVTKLDPSDADSYKLLARVYQSKNMWKESIDACEEAIARGSDSPWTYNNLGFAYLVLGKSDDAVRELEKAVSFDSGVTSPIWNNLGLAYEKKGELADAAGAYRAALAGNPNYVKAKVNLNRLTEVAKEEGIAIGARKAEMGPMPSPTPAEKEGAAIGEKTMDVTGSQD
jgi:tetratricopeptide (TPR) repeat protein